MLPITTMKVLTGIVQLVGAAAISLIETVLPMARRFAPSLACT
jgi:hypothetical protein